MAPALWWAEVRNVLLMAERRGRITPPDPDVSTGLRAIGRLNIRLDHAPESGAFLRISRTHRLSAYDALYLELAVRDGRPLASLDRSLIHAAAAEGVPAA